MKIIKKIETSLDKKFMKYPNYVSFKEDYGFRTIVFTVFSITLNFIFSIVNGVTAIKYKSFWYSKFSIYYLILGIQRITVLLSYYHTKKKYKNNKVLLDRAKTKIYIANGAFLIPLEIAVAALIVVIILKGKPSTTGEILAITTATYAFIKISMAIRNILKAHSSNDLLIQTIRNIGIVDAITSMISLQATLISTFGTIDEDMSRLIAICGLVSSIFIISLAIYMIIKGTKKLKRKEIIENE